MPDAPHTLFTADLDTVSLKRLAWAYGCARKGSFEERELRRLLVEKIHREFKRPSKPSTEAA